MIRTCKWSVLLLVVFLSFLLVIVLTNRPIVVGGLTKQTVYLWFLNIFHIKDCHRQPTFMLVDDDSGIGIFKIYEICERVGVKATFAVVPAFLDSVRCDSLRSWHREGYGIALHGFNHGKLEEWTEKEIVDDIQRSVSFLESRGIAEREQVKMVVTPGSHNTRDIRKAVYSQGLKMVVGAQIVNPDTTTFQWGRIFITQLTNMNQVREILFRAKSEKGFVVFGTHSSNPEEFSAQKTEAVLQMAVEMGFRFR